MTNSPLDDPGVTAIGLFMEAHSALSERFAAQYQQHGVTAVEFEVLLRLARSPEHQLRMRDLATQASLSTSGVTRVVDRMEGDGLVCRRACPGDRRSLFTAITPAGLALLDEILPGHLALIAKHFTGPLAPAQRQEFLSSLRVIRDGMHPEATAGTSPE